MIDRLQSIYYKTKYGIQNLFIWLPVIWNDRAWDYHFLFKLLHKKLSLMEVLFRKHGSHVYAERDAKKMKTCILLLDRLMDDNYASNASIHHDKKWGKLEMKDVPSDKPGMYTCKFERKFVKNENDEKQENRSFKRIVKRERLSRKQDIDLLTKLISKHVHSWWD